MPVSGTRGPRMDGNASSRPRLVSIATGMVDWILPVAEIASRLLDYYGPSRTITGAARVLKDAVLGLRDIRDTPQAPQPLPAQRGLPA